MYKQKTTRIIAFLISLIIFITLLCPMHVSAASIGRVMMITKGNETTVTMHDNNGEERVIDKVPLFNQGDYPNDPYGEWGSVASHGCGITSVAMIVTYLKDEYYSPVNLAIQFANYNTENGSYWSLFADSAKALGIEQPEQTSSWKKVREALENGQVVVSLQGEGLFTSGGHFIVLTGVNDDNKIMVNDPNGNNWAKDSIMIDGFANGFTDNQITEAGRMYWIYAPKHPNDAQTDIG